MASEPYVAIHIWPGDASGMPSEQGSVAPLAPDVRTPPSEDTVTRPKAVGAVTNVSEEEACNSFPGQQGRFTVHQGASYADDPSLVTTGGAYAFFDTSSQLKVGGDAAFGATIPDDLLAYLRAQPAVTWFATERDFAALVTVGSSNRLIVWGASILMDKTGYPLAGIRAAYANRHAIAFIYETTTASGYRIGAIGDEAKGGKITEDIHLKLANDEPVSIRATESAFTVITRAGKVYAWGDATAGGTISPDAVAILAGMKVEKVFAASRAFCAVGQDGAPVAWGATGQGGDLPSSALEAILDDDGVHTIVASQGAFCCITKRRRKLIAWGSSSHGGSMHAAAASFSAMGDIVGCKAAAYAFCAINRSGKIESWGHASHGGVMAPVSDLGVQSADALPQDTDAALVTDIESVLADSAGGARVAETWTGPSFATPEWTAHLYACDSGFCLITAFPDDRIRSVHAWGAASTLPPQTVRQVLLGSQLDGVVSGNLAYLALLRYGSRKGRVVVWGEAVSNGGVLPPEVRAASQCNVISASAINRLPPKTPGTEASAISGFHIRCDDGTRAFWGKATGTVVVPPDRD